MVETKIIRCKCIEKTCDLFGEMIYFSTLLPSNNKRYNFATFYCEHNKIHMKAMQEEKRLKEGITCWNEKTDYRLLELLEQGNNYEITNAKLNKEFGLSMSIRDRPKNKGKDGAIINKLEDLKENAIDWQQYTDDKVLLNDTILMFKRNKKNKHKIYKEYSELLLERKEK